MVKLADIPSASQGDRCFTKGKSQTQTNIDTLPVKDSDGFENPKYHLRKSSRQYRQERRRVMTDSAPAVGSVKGGSKGSPFRDIFVYRVDKEVATDDLYSYITGKDIKVHKLQCKQVVSAHNTVGRLLRVLQQ